MATVVGIWIALVGMPPLLAGLSGMRRKRRLRRDGVKAWAVAIARPDDDKRQVKLQYALADGRVLETSIRTAAKKPGETVLIWYEPADPSDILVYGRYGRASDLAFATIGVAFVLAGIGIGIFGS